jgi:hypothetical protein
MSVMRSLTPPSLIHRFLPFTTYASPSSVAVVVKARISEPACGSVMAAVDTQSPEKSFGSQRRFCSSLPR